MRERERERKKDRERERISDNLVGTDRDQVSACNLFIRSVVMLFVTLYRVYYMEPLSFDSPAETDIVRRFPTSVKVLCPA